MMRVLKLCLVSSMGLTVMAANAFDLEVSNNTGHDVQSVVLYNDGSAISDDTCISPDGVETDMTLTADPDTYGTISAAFIKRYSSSDGSCTMQSSKVAYSNIVSFDPDDLNDNSTKLHYSTFTSTGLNMTPVVIFNPAISSVAMYTGYRQGDTGQDSYAYYTANDTTLSSPSDDSDAYNEDTYITSEQSLYLY